MVADACDHLTVVSRSMRVDLMNMGVESAQGVRYSHGSGSPAPICAARRAVPPAESLLFRRAAGGKKGIAVSLGGDAENLKTIPQVQLTVVGDGPSRLELEKLASDLGLRGVCPVFRCS